MNDSLILEGKIFISAKRAAALTGYTTDYVGQLCRAGKLECKMIGHTWHVSQASLFGHKLSQTNYKSAESVQAKNRESDIAQNLNQEKFVSAKPIDNLQLSSPSISPIANQTVRSNVWSNDGNNLIKASVEDFARKVDREIMARKNIGFAEAKASSGKIDAEDQTRGINSGRVVSNQMRSGRIALVITSVCLVIIVAINLLGLQFESVGRFALLSSSDESATAHNSAMLSLAGEPGLNGIVVAPSTNSAEGDEVLKQQIRDSFTDDVNVEPDENGMAGVITPIFKKVSDGGFVYVLVPVKDDKKNESAIINSDYQKYNEL